MIHYRQSGKRNCGQIAVAALTEKTVEEIELLIGHSHGTRTKELVAVLKRLNYGVADHCISHLRYIHEPMNCIAQVHGNKSGWHWIAISHGIVYDGHLLAPEPIAEYRKYIANRHDGRITSYLPVTRVWSGAQGDALRMIFGWEDRARHNPVVHIPNAEKTVEKSNPTTNTPTHT